MTARRAALKLPLLAAAAGLARRAHAAGKRGELDLLIRGGRVVDGTANPWYRADVGVAEGRIAAVGRLEGTRARRVIDAAGRVVAPGFVDVHTHVEREIRELPAAENLLLDGVTSIITGNCGFSEVELRTFLEQAVAAGLSLNLASLVGHGAVRKAVLGTEARAPTAEEQARMEELVDRAMREGAMGISTGLIYTPGTYARTDEIIGLARVVARHGGVYVSHIRDEGAGVFEAIAEAIGIGRAAGLPVQISHFKISSRRLWNQTTRTLALVEKARAEGLDVTIDQYPYTASSTSLGVLMPSWTHEGGESERNRRLADPATRRRIVDEMKVAILRRQGHPSLDYAVVARCAWDPAIEGKSLARINRERGRPAGLPHEIGTLLDLMERGGAQMIYHGMDERDVERVLRYPHTMVASDGGVQKLGQGVPHPRNYGTRARVLGRYVRERRALSLEEAVRKMASLPAQRFGLTDRGVLRPGMWADVVVFDPGTITDRSTFERPHAYSDGVHAVLVNGQVVVEGGEHTGARPGRILRGPGAA